MDIFFIKVFWVLYKSCCMFSKPSLNWGCWMFFQEDSVPAAIAGHLNWKFQQVPDSSFKLPTSFFRYRRLTLSTTFVESDPQCDKGNSWIPVLGDPPPPPPSNSTFSGVRSRIQWSVATSSAKLQTQKKQLLLVIGNSCLTWCCLWMFVAYSC